MIDGAAVPCSRDDQAQFGIGHSGLALILEPEQAEGLLGDETEGDAQRRDDGRDEIDGGDHEPSDALGVRHADRFGEQFDEEERNGREGNGAVGFPLGAEERRGEVGEYRGGVDGARGGRDEYGRQYARDILVQHRKGALLAAPRVLLFFLLGEFANLPRIQGRHRDLGGVKEGQSREENEPQREEPNELLAIQWRGGGASESSPSAGEGRSRSAREHGHGHEEEGQGSAGLWFRSGVTCPTCSRGHGPYPTERRVLAHDVLDSGPRPREERRSAIALTRSAGICGGADISATANAGNLPRLPRDDGIATIAGRTGPKNIQSRRRASISVQSRRRSERLDDASPFDR
mmetsp:Transcript_8227/g.24665  ORF Transcript_8227/g.24665 Transcript_8227/m.24665 type:complete len:347 (-) Transcript_8227:131-1171(-)